MGTSNFNGFPTDGSYGSQIKYDMFAKYMGNAIHSAGSSKSGNTGFVGFVFAIFQIVLVIILTLILLLGKIVGFFINLFNKKRIGKLRREASNQKEVYLAQLREDLKVDEYV